MKINSSSLWVSHMELSNSHSITLIKEQKVWSLPSLNVWLLQQEKSKVVQVLESIPLTIGEYKHNQLININKWANMLILQINSRWECINNSNKLLNRAYIHSKMELHFSQHQTWATHRDHINHQSKIYILWTTKEMYRLSDMKEKEK